MNDEYMNLHLEWRSDITGNGESDITGNGEIVIDEAIFEEIYRMQEAQDDKERIQGNKGKDDQRKRR